MKPVILHISSDYPDPLQPDKTKAISRLVEGTPEFRHVVYSLNRVNGLGGLTSLPFGEDSTAVAYGALPKGIFWGRRLDDVARWIIADLKQKNIRPDIVEAHKFTVEGLIGQRVVAEFSCPLICDIQGGSDVTILKVKKSLRARYREIARTVALVFPYAHWTQSTFMELVNLDPEKCRFLPVIPGVDHLLPSRPVGGDRLVSVFHLDQYRRKNFPRLIEAIAKLSQSRPHVTLDVYGSGNPKNLLQIRKLIEQAGMGRHITLKGAAPNGSLPQIMSSYAAFVMPTLLDTYALVFAEALFAGLPLLHSKDRAIDGYFDRDAIGYACDPTSMDDIIAGINYLLDHEAEIKQRIAALQSSGGIDIMRRDTILETYRTGIRGVLSLNAAPAEEKLKHAV